MKQPPLSGKHNLPLNRLECRRAPHGCNVCLTWVGCLAGAREIRTRERF
jgi:hypothetical protein